MNIKKNIEPLQPTGITQEEQAIVNMEDKTKDEKTMNQSAFGFQYHEINGYGAEFDLQEFGLSKREYAAIRLSIPDSGIDWLDKMIAKVEKRDLTIKAFQAICSFKDAEGMELHNIRDNALEQAEIIIAERAKEE